MIATAGVVGTAVGIGFMIYGGKHMGRQPEDASLRVRLQPGGASLAGRF